MNDKQHQVFLETRLRNLERKYARMAQHADLTDSALEVKKEINNIKSELHLQ